MKPFSPEAAAALRRVKAVGEPSRADHAAVRARLAARLGASTFDAPLPPAHGGDAGVLHAAAGRLWGTKVLVGLAMTVGAGAVVHALAQGAPELPAAGAPSIPATAVRTRLDSIPRAPSLTPAWTQAPSTRAQAPRSSEPSARAKIDAVARAPKPTSPPPPSAPSEPSDPPEPSEEPTASTVADEAEVLLRAHAALVAGDSATALAALHEHARRFPQGALTEERSSERVLALCAAGRTDEARAEGRRFLAEHPSSPASNRVRASCAMTRAREP